MESAILNTLGYADRFDSPLTLAELHRGLIGEASSVEELMSALAGLSPRVRSVGGYYFLEGREDLVALRDSRREKSRRLLERTGEFVRRLAALPFVEGIFLSGANAFENPADDDVDFFLVCRPGTCWLTLLSAALLGHRLGVRRLICPNYIVDSDHLAIPERTFYTASQLVHLRPLTGRRWLDKLFAANPWVNDFYPNASVPGGTSSHFRKSRWPWGAARILGILAGIFYRAYLCRRLNLRPQPPSVILSGGRLKLHTVDHSREYPGMRPEPVPSTAT